MATYSGSGRFVALAANDNPFEFPQGVSGVVFGVGTSIYGRITPRYTLSGTTVTGTALCIDPGAVEGNLYLNFPSLTVLKVNGYTGYTGQITVVNGTSYNQSTDRETPTFTNYGFRNGLLLNPYST